MKSITENDISFMKDKECYILFYFTAKWCGPCQKIKPLLEKLSEGSDPTKLEIYMVDIDENDDLCEKCGITSVPTFMLFKHKEEVGQCGGANIEKVADLIKPYC